MTVPWLAEGPMADRVRAHDWGATPLGPIGDWSATLRTAASLCLHSRFPTALWWGPDLVAIYNDPYAEYLGPAKHPYALGRSYRDVWSELWPAVRELFADLFENGSATWREDRQFTIHRHGYAEEAFFTFNLSPVPDETGATMGALNVVVETTATVLAHRRMRALQRASAASAGSRTAIEAGAAVAAELAEHTSDLPFTILYRVTGEDAERIGMSHLAAGHPAAPETLSVDDERWPLRRALRTGEPVQVDGVDERFDDALPGGPWDETPRQALVIPMVRGDLVAALIAGISPRRRLDRDYRRFLESLADAIAAALADAAAQERERRFRLEAEHANRAKSDFLTAMSHELRTPLNAVAGYVDLLEAGVYGDLSEEQMESLERIRANQRHLLTLINDVLLFARIEAARLEFDEDVLQASELVESLEPLIHPQALGKGVDYEIQECDPGIRVVGDRERVRQILLNLTGNAIKFTPAGGRVSLACRPSTQSGQVEFRVTDTGPGIPPGSEDDIFDPFSQVERRLDSPREGAGLGLAISRDMARAMGGDITVDSEPGRGSTFIVTLPRSDREPEDS